MMVSLRATLRSLRRSPTFTAVAVATLALGIGANTAVFSVVNAALLTRPPFDHPDRLALIASAAPGATAGAEPVSFPNYTDLRAGTRAFDDVGAWTSFGPTAFALTGSGAPERVQYAMGTASLFRVLRVAPELGRIFTDREDQFGTAQHVVLMSDGMWRRRFGANPGLLGTAIILDNVPYTVIGILPPTFSFVTFPARPELWVPLGLDPINQGRHYGRGVKYLGAIGRLKPSATVAAANQDLRRMSAQLVRDYPEAERDLSMRAEPLTSGAVANLRPALVVLLGAVALVLLIACANVANLMLARATTRRREVAVRAALGATPGRMVRMLLAECLLLSVAGALLGVLLASWGTHALAAFPLFGAPDPALPYRAAASDIAVNLPVLGFTVAVTLVTTLLFGLAPARRLTRTDLADLMQSGQRSGSGLAERRAREALVVVEVALALMLLIGAGLVVRSLEHLGAVDMGFQPDRVLAVDLSLVRSTHPTPAAWLAFFGDLRARAAAMPGVESAALVDQPPLSGPVESTDFRIDGRSAPDPTNPPIVPYIVVSPDYFQTLRVAIVRGRVFTVHDDSLAPKVAVINEAMARKYWPGEDPVGKRFVLSVEALRIGPHGEPSFDWAAAMRQVVGVVRDIRQTSLALPAEPDAYLPDAQMPVPGMTLLVRTGGDPATLARGVRDAVAAIDPGQPVSAVRPLDDVVARSIGQPRFRAILFGLFGVLAGVLAAAGIYGVMSYTVSQRSRELGIRAALGADRAEVLRLVLGTGLRLTALGVAVGLVAAVFCTRLLAGLLFRVPPLDPASFAGAAGILAVISVAACWRPARRATRVDPVEVLKDA